MLSYKICGLTMKQFLEEINAKSSKKYTYTTRLDPMAQGMVNLIEETEFKKIDKHISSNKVYHVRVIFGIQTDSDDVLGYITKTELNYINKNLSKYFPYFIKLNTTFYQKYHYFSSKRIQFRRKKEETTIPTHPVTIFQSKVINSGNLYLYDWIESFLLDLDLVDKTQNFRQKEIINQWKDFQKLNKNLFLNFIDLELDVSSGFFVRQFIRDISEEINFPMLAYHINRIKIY